MTLKEKKYTLEDDMNKKIKNLGIDELKQLLELVIEENNNLIQENCYLKKTIKKIQCSKPRS